MYCSEVRVFSNLVCPDVEAKKFDSDEEKWVQIRVAPASGLF